MIDSIPSIGFGVGTSWSKGSIQGSTQVNQDLVDAIQNALSVGYRHLDFAEWYNNEAECAAALRNTSTDREDLWITTKVVHSMVDPVSYIEKTLAKFGLKYFDCVLIHTPFQFTEDVTLEDTWRKMETLCSAGLARYIGVSNFRKTDLEEVMRVAKIKPYINQCESHPYVQHQQSELQEYMKKHDIKWASYAPLASITRSPNGPVDPLVSKLAVKYGKSESQILLRWQMELGHIAITTSSKLERMRDQLQALNFTLQAEDVRAITETGSKLYYRGFFKDEIDGKAIQDGT